MEFSAELFDLVSRFVFNVFIAYIIIMLIYHRENYDNDFVFTYFMFNSLIFFFAYLLGNMDINIGFAFGLFAVFAILRYRTDPIPIKEMTYLFIVITIGVINAIGSNEVSNIELLFTNSVLVFMTFVLEKYWRNNLLTRQSIVYDNLENVKPENHEKLHLDLEDKIGRSISYFKIRRIFLKKVNINIFYKE